MKEIFKDVARFIAYAVFNFIIAAVILKLWNKEENWMIISILCGVANFSANIIFAIRVYLLQNENGQAQIIDFVTKKEKKNKIDFGIAILEIITITASVYFILAFFSGVLLEAKNWKDITWSPMLFFAGTYMECMYKYSKTEL